MLDVIAVDCESEKDNTYLIERFTHHKEDNAMGLLKRAAFFFP